VRQQTDAVAAAVAERVATAVYVYGVTRRNSEPVRQQIAGVGGHAAVRAIEGGEFAALVSDVPADWHATSRKEVAAHDQVLSELMGDRTIVPMRFGIVLASDAAVRERLLQRHATELATFVDRLDGCEQMSVKAYYEDEALLRAVLVRRPELKRRADELEQLPVARTQAERIALGQDVAAAVQEQRALDERALGERLSGPAEEVQVDPAVGDRHLTTVQLLVRRDRRAALDAEVKRLADELSGRIAVRYVGPLPAYSFCAFALDTEREPWG
jgi:hypothetical protein